MDVVFYHFRVQRYKHYKHNDIAFLITSLHFVCKFIAFHCKNIAFLKNHARNFAMLYNPMTKFAQMRCTKKYPVPKQPLFAFQQNYDFSFKAPKKSHFF